MSDDLKTLVAQEVSKQLAAIAADQTTKKVLDFLKNRNSADAYVVETWQSGTEWYRVWSDGLIEQGGIGTTASNGIVSLTFKKPFAAANYFLYGLMDHSSNSAVAFKCVENPPKTSSSATLKATYCINGESGILNNTSFSWFAIGF